MSPKKKILILRFSSIGDIVLTTPVVRALKKQLQRAEVHFAIKQQYTFLMKHNPYVDKVHPLEGSLMELIARLRAEKFDYIVDLHHNLRTFIVKRALGVSASSFHKLNLKKWLLVHLRFNLLPSVHIVDRYLAAAAPLGVKNDHQGLDFFIPDRDRVARSSLPAACRSGYVAYAIGGQHNTKRLPVDKMIELCHAVGRPVILLGGAEDRADGERVKAFFDPDGAPAPLAGKTVIDNACGRYNLNQSASVAQQADFVVAHDTGMMHIAAALKKNVVSIWGNTVPAFGMYPYQTRFTVLENHKAKCRPCSKIGFEKCPKGHFDCMRKMTFEGKLPFDEATLHGSLRTSRSL